MWMLNAKEILLQYIHVQADVSFAALAHGKSKISGLLEGEDVLKTAAALRLMQVDIKKENDHIKNRKKYLQLIEDYKYKLD